LVRMAARTAVVAGTATAVSGRVARRQQRKAYEEQAQMQAQAAPAADVGAPAGEEDFAAELEKLADLKSKGIITQDEFDAKKKQILGL
jgi:membrane protease subunit (stomatin/prohibitin family)